MTVGRIYLVYSPSMRKLLTLISRGTERQGSPKHSVLSTMKRRGVDNFNGIKIKGENHCSPPCVLLPPSQASEGVDGATKVLWEKGCGAQCFVEFI